jgi:hypothetical protein
MKRGPANGFGLLGESATLRVGPPNALLANLFAQCLILGLQVFDHGLLMTANPSGEHEKEKLPVEVHFDAT